MPYFQCDDFKGAVNKFANTYAKISSDFNIPKIIKINLFYLSQHVVTELLIGLHCVSEKTPP